MSIDPWKSYIFSIKYACAIVFDLHQWPKGRSAREIFDEQMEGASVRLLLFCLTLSTFGVAPAAVAADADNGKRLAEAKCVTCHAVGPAQRREVADAPPFETIARKFAFSPELLAFAMLEPHPRMSVSLTRREAQDIAAYINTLAK